MKKIAYYLLLTFLVQQLTAQEKTIFKNPVIRGDMADPSIIRIDDTYYATGTSSEWAPHYPVFTSKDLVNWKQKGHVFTKQPEWTLNSFWAPELFYYANKVYCYYTARQESTGISYIGVATASSSLNEFTDHGPLVEYGREAIDAFVYNDNGQLYISWKAYGLDRRPIELLASRLSADGLRMEGEPFSLLIDDEEIGMEGQYHFKNGDYYYIVYSTHSCCGSQSDYDVCVARAKNFEGPYEKYAGNPVLHGGEGDYLSCGHGTVVISPDRRMFYMCHAYLKGEGFYGGRQPILQEMEMTADHWVRFKTGSLAIIEQPIPFEGVIQKELPDFEDRFNGKDLKVEWTWNYPYSEIHTVIKKGKLYLSGSSKGENKYGTALCLRPQSPHYACETKVANANESLKGLTLYGDDKNLIAWGLSGQRLLLKSVKDGVEVVHYEVAYSAKDIYLKFEVEGGCILRFYMSLDGKKWQEVQTTPLHGEFLARWDRVQRPGLLHIGEKEAPAEFDYFKMINK